MTQTRQKPNQNALKNIAGLGLLAGAVLLFAGCSEIDTNLVVDEDLSGQRIMDVYISDSDLAERVDATPAELDAVAEASLPSALTYVPFAAVEGGMQAQFTLSFSDPEDYLGKVESLIAASGFEFEPEVLISVADSPFSKGVFVDENFTSEDLLYFYTDALIEAGIIDESNRSDVFSSRYTAVTIDGEEYEVGAQIHVDTVETTGMQTVSMATAYEDGLWQRTLTLAMSEANYEETSRAVDDYFSQHTPGEAVIDMATESGTVVWTVTLPAMSPADVASATNDLLLTDTAIFEVEADPISTLFGTRLSITDRADCSQICYYPDAAITELLDLGEGFEATDIEGDFFDTGEGVLEFAADGQMIEVDQYYPLDGLEAHLKFGFTGGAQLALDLLVPSDVATENDEHIRGIFETDNGDVELAVSSSEDWTSYETVLSAESPEQLGVLLSEYLPGSSLSFEERSGLFKRSYNGILTLDLSERLGMPAIANGAVYTIDLPALHSFSKSAPAGASESVLDPLKGHDEDLDDLLGLLDELDDTLSDLGGELGGSSGFYRTPVEKETAEVVTIQFAASGWTLTGLIIVGVAVLLVLAALLVLFLNRKKIKARRDISKERKVAALAAQQAQMQAATPMPPPGMPASPGAPLQGMPVPPQQPGPERPSAPSSGDQVHNGQAPAGLVQPSEPSTVGQPPVPPTDGYVFPTTPVHPPAAPTEGGFSEGPLM